MTDTLIIGGGPAGLQLAYFLEKAGRDYQILEAGEVPGAFYETYPRHRQLISINKRYTGSDDPELNLRWDWNSLLSDDDEMRFTRYSRDYFPSADDLLTYLHDFARRYQLDIRYRTRIVRIEKQDGIFKATDSEGGEHFGRRLVVATGISTPYVPEIAGIELAENYADMSVDPEDFAGQRVLILGKGNSAFETADNLIPTAALIHLVSPRRLQMAWKTHFVGHLRAVNNGLLDTYQLKSQNAVLDATVNYIKRRDDGFEVEVAYQHANGEVERLYYDRVIACTGFRFDPSIFDSGCRPELAINDRFPKQTSEWESENVEGLYFAGAVTQQRDFKKSTSAFIHGFRYNTRALFRILEQKFHDVEWPHWRLPINPTALRDAVIERINRSSALWQQFGFLADVLQVSESEGVVRYFEEVPVDYVHQGGLGSRDHYYLVTLEYGGELEDPFNVERIERHDVERAEKSMFLHPVIRHFHAGEQVEEHHVIEDLTAEWVEDVHLAPLLEFFDHQMRAVA